MMSVLEFFIFFLSWSYVNSEKLLIQNESDFTDTWSPSNFSLFPTLPIAVPTSRDEKCREDSRKLILNLRNKTFWAMQMWDSSATSAFGVLYGNIHHLGNFDECLAVKAPVRAQYCEVKVRAKLFKPERFNGDPYELDPEPTASVWKKFQDSHRDHSKATREESFWGLCIPASCNPTELQYGLDEYLHHFNAKQLANNDTTYSAEVLEKFCENGDEAPVSPGEIGFWTLCAVLLVLVAITTMVDFQLTEDDVKKESRYKKMLMSFSVKRNILTMFDRDEGGKSKELAMVYGLRFYNTCYIVADHRIGTTLASSVFDSQKFEEAFRSWQNVILPNGDLFVDTFFFVGGLLAVSILLHIYRKKYVNPIMLILHRMASNPTAESQEDNDSILRVILFSESKKMRVFMAFSAKRNAVNWYYSTVDDEQSTPELRMLYGLKCFTIVFITLDHRVATFLGAAIFNRQKVESALRDVHNFFLPHGDLLVDTFFFVGGLLCCYLLLDAFKKRMPNPLLIIIARYIRLGPLYFFIVWFHASALLRFGSGPGWRFGLEHEAEYCQKNWWANVLFIQNYVNSKEMCMIHAWYLPCDVHFFIMAIFLVMLIKKNKKIGLYTLGGATIISILIPGIITYIYELNPTVIFYHDFLSNPRNDTTFQYLYIKSHTRATVYLLGIITGYILHAYRGSTKKISYATSIIGCIVGLALLFAPMAYGSLYYDPRREYSVIESSIFASLRRTSWGLAFVLFLMINRFGTIPIVGWIFEWKIAVPLSKVAYAVYLIHFVIQMTDQAKVKIPYQFIIYDMFVKGTNDLAFATGYALVLYLIVELPFRLIFKELIFASAAAKHQKQNARLQEVVSNNQVEAPKVFSVKL